MRRLYHDDRLTGDKTQPFWSEALLINETVRRMGTKVRLHIGTPRPFGDLPSKANPKAMLAALMELTCGLHNRTGGADDADHRAFAEATLQKG